MRKRNPIFVFVAILMSMAASTFAQEQVSGENTAIGGVSPRVEITSPSDGGRYPSYRDVVVKVAAVDDSGIDRVVLFLDGVEQGILQEAPYEWNLGTLEPAKYTLRGEAFAVDGESVSTELSIDVYPDEELTVEISSPLDGALVSSSSKVTVVAADDDDGIEALELYIEKDHRPHAYARRYFRPAAPSGSFVFDLGKDLFSDYGRTPILLEKGVYTLRVEVRNGEHDFRQSEDVTFEVNEIGAVAPRVRIISPADGGRYPSYQDVIVKAAAVDNSGIYCVRLIVDGAVHSTVFEAPYEWNLGELEPGTHTFKAWAYAKEERPDGRLESVSIEISTEIYLEEELMVEIESPLDGAQVSSSSKVTVVAADDDDGIEALELYIEKDHHPYAYARQYFRPAAPSGSFVFDLGKDLFSDYGRTPILLEKGVYALRVEVRNGEHDFQQSEEITFEVTEIGAVAPRVAVTSPSDGGRYPSYRDVIVKAAAVDNSGIYCVRLMVDGAVHGTAFKSPYEWNLGKLEPGTHTFKAWAYAKEERPDGRLESVSTEISTEIYFDEELTVGIASPANGAQVSPASEVTIVAADDDDGIEVLELHIEKDHRPYAYARQYFRPAAPSGAFVFDLGKDLFSDYGRTPILLEKGIYTMRVEARNGEHDFRQSAQISFEVTDEAANNAPVIEVVAASSSTIALGEAVTLYVAASDPDGDALTYSWTSHGPGGVTFSHEHDSKTSAVMAEVGEYFYQVTVSDGGLSVTGEVVVEVLESQVNLPPVILSAASATPPVISLGETSSLSVIADDPDGDPLSYSWYKISGPGSIAFEAADSNVTDAAFSTAGSYELEVSVSDGLNSVTNSVEVLVLSGPAEELTVEIVFPGDYSYVTPDSDVIICAKRGVSPGADAAKLDLYQDEIVVATTGWRKMGLALVVDLDSDLKDPVSGKPVAFESGSFVLVATAEDDDGTPVVSKGINIKVRELPVAPVINEVSVGKTPVKSGKETTLRVSAFDPNGQTLTFNWQKLRGPGLVTIQDGETSNPTAVFSVEGTYVLEVAVRNGNLMTSSQVMVDVVTAVPGFGVSITSPADGQRFIADTEMIVINIETLETEGRISYLDCIVEDENDELVIARGIQGGGPLTISSEPLPAGHYIVRAMATTETGEVVVDEIAIDVVAGQENHAPVIESVTVTPSIIELGGTTSLNVSASDSDGDNLSYQWECVSGPAKPLFADSTAPISGVKGFDASGTYELTITVSDGQFSVTNHVTVTVLTSYSLQVNISYPLNDDDIIEGRELVVKVNASDDTSEIEFVRLLLRFSDGSIQIYDHENTEPEYHFNVGSLPQGTYLVNAYAGNSNGVRFTSERVMFRVTDEAHLGITPEKAE